ncbi:hypothetical protein [Porphyromonas somerae]|uniref:hypothetical protein n=1 Tax=Porphyromonas somerae TaxID=322095 RepID=UPI001FCB6A25|nr:hypothetical protein [Porphyromonas somerae]BDE82453.1 hypothetical protein CE91St14_14810 [Porphyromonas somerae]
MAIEVEREYIQKWAKVHLPDYKSRIASMDYIIFTKDDSNVSIETRIRTLFYGTLLSFAGFTLVFKEFERIFLNVLEDNVDVLLLKKHYGDHFITALYDFSYSDYYVFPKQLESEEELEIYLQEFVKCVRYHENVIFPYLSDITNMAKYVGSVPFERSLEINVGGGYPVSFFKKLAILKWGGYEERYEEYKKGLEAFIEEGFSDPEEAVEAPLNKEGFVNLINYLENKPNPFLKS